MKLPIYVYVRDIAVILGWKKPKTMRWLRAANVLSMRGGRWVVTTDKLREAFPEVWEELLNESEDKEVA